MAQIFTSKTINRWNGTGIWGSPGSRLAGLVSAPFPPSGVTLDVSRDVDEAAQGGDGTGADRVLYSGAALTGAIEVTGRFGVKMGARSQSTGSYQALSGLHVRLALADQANNLYPLKEWDFTYSATGRTYNTYVTAAGGGSDAPNRYTETGQSGSDGVDYGAFTATVNVAGATTLRLALIYYVELPGGVYIDAATAISGAALGITVEISGGDYTPGGSGAISVNDGGTIKSVGTVYVNDNGTIKACRVYVNDNGVIKNVM